MTKIIDGSKWENCLRLVNRNDVDTTNNASSNVSVTSSFHRNNFWRALVPILEKSAPELGRRSSARNKSVSFNCVDTNSTDANRTANHMVMMASSNSTSVPSRRSNTRDDASAISTTRALNHSAPESGRPTTKSASFHCGTTATSTNTATNSSVATPTKTSIWLQPTSPTTSMVNLNAKHFCGSRRKFVAVWIIERQWFLSSI